LATFVKILNQEDISLHQHQDTMQEVNVLFHTISRILDPGVWKIY